MKIGDIVRLRAGLRRQDLADVDCCQIGVVKFVDGTCKQQAVLISFPDAEIYSSALKDSDVELVDSPVRERDR